MSAKRVSLSTWVNQPQGANVAQREAGKFSRFDGVELAKVGTWAALTGTLKLSTADLAAAVAAAPHLPRIPLKIGHTDSRFDGEPALGWVENLRTTNRGTVLVGDIVDVPVWLASSLPTAYPRRSIEAIQNYERDGATYRFVLTALSLLGVTAPAINDLNQLQQLLERK